MNTVVLYEQRLYIVDMKTVSVEFGWSDVGATFLEGVELGFGIVNACGKFKVRVLAGHFLDALDVIR